MVPLATILTPLWRVAASACRVVQVLDRRLASLAETTQVARRP